MSKLILVRHGQSEWNLANRFTGWWDVDLTEKGEAEAREAGELMKAKGVLPTTAFTSLQKRAIKTMASNCSGRTGTNFQTKPKPQSSFFWNSNRCWSNPIRSAVPAGLTTQAVAIFTQ